MYERCLNEAERLLATSKDIVVPIKEVWKSLAAEGKRRSFDVPALTDFDALLEGDKRFEIFSAQTEPDQIELLLSEEGEEIDSNLGTLGFYPEDRVKLRRIKLPGTVSHSTGSLKESDDDEEVVPFNVRGLSATKPVGPVDTKKQNPKKASPGPKARLKSSPKRATKKRNKKVGVKRKMSGNPSRRTR
jgi:hypothetical protein